MSEIVNTRTVTRVRHDPPRRDVEIVDIHTAGANLLRVTVAGDALDGFTSLGFDDHLKFIFADRDGGEHKRDITPRRYDADALKLVLEFAMHEGGEINAWAATAQRGDRVTIGGPKSSIVVPVDYPWQVLAGDLTALPAIARRLEELPADTRRSVVVLAPDVGDHGLLTESVGAVSWVRSNDEFIAALEALTLPDQEGFIWAAGEAGLMARVRDLFVTRRAYPRNAMRIAGYWKRDETGFHETLERGV